MFEYSLSLSLGSGRIKSFDTDASAYMSAVTTAGATLTGAQRNAINAFVVAEKAASRWAGIKRLYLPVWGVAAANAICMKSLASGTWNGSVTHASGYVQGDGATGYFDMGTTMAAQSLSQNDAMQFVLTTQLGTANRFFIGASTTSTLSTTPVFTANGATLSKSVTWTTGILLWSTEAGPDAYIARRITSGWTVDDAGIGAPTTAIPAVNCYALARNNSGAGGFCDGRIGCVGFSLGMTQSGSEAFTSNLKTLWETVTGLTLP